MAVVLYVGPRSPLAAAAAKRVRKAGHNFVIIRPHDAVRRIRESGCDVIVLGWTFARTGLTLARAAKKLDIPVIVVTGRLAVAFRAFGSLAEVLLEQPATPAEVATLAMDLAQGREPARPLRKLAVASAA